MRNLIRTSLSRILAAPLAAAVAWLGIPATTGQELEGAALTALTLVLYGVVHKAIDAVGLNPDDNAAESS